MAEPLRIGVFGARADQGGLAAMTWEFCRHMQPDKTVVIDLGARGRGASRLERYPGATVIAGMDDQITLTQIDEFLDDLDVVYLAETAYRADFCERAEARGVATVLHAMPELWRADHHRPTKVWAPTTWELDRLPPDAEVVPVPIATDRLPPLPRSGGVRQIHLSAPAMADRNGTHLVVDACAHVRDVHVDLHLAGWRGRMPSERGFVRATRSTEEVEDYWDRWTDDVDVLVLPRRYGGLSLPMSEAAARGMPVITLAVGPQDEWVMPELAVPAYRWREVQMAGGPFVVWGCDPRRLGAVMTCMAADPDLAAAASQVSLRYAAGLAWTAWTDRYRQLLERACR